MIDEPTVKKILVCSGLRCELHKRISETGVCCGLHTETLIVTVAPNGSRHMTPLKRTAEVWLEIWSAQPAWTKEWMLQFIRDIQREATFEQNL